MVDDPSSRPEKFPTEDAQEKERQRLFNLIEDLVKCKKINDEQLFLKIHEEILRSTNGIPPPILDPFCGGGSIPVEAQRLGLEVYASDLNPVAVLITKAMIEIPQKFADLPPVNPTSRSEPLQRDLGNKWIGSLGLAEDVKYYGIWMLNKAENRISFLYPKVELPIEQGNNKGIIFAYIYCRTMICPNPACRATMPLVKTFWLSSKEGKKVWIEPLVDKQNKTIRFEVRKGQGEPRKGTIKPKKGATCVFCDPEGNMLVPMDYIRNEGKNGRLGYRLMAIVAIREKNRSGKIYLSPTKELESFLSDIHPEYKPDQKLGDAPRYISPPLFGFESFGDLFTPRQLIALTTFSDLIADARELAHSDAIEAGLSDNKKRLNDGGNGAFAYADAIATYLAFVIDRCADYWSSFNGWQAANQQLSHTFSRQAIQMVWDFAEANPFSGEGGSFNNLLDWTIQSLPTFSKSSLGHCAQLDARLAGMEVSNPMVVTDPPYYDNVPYADLSDYFYIWLRRSLKEIFPDIFSTLLSPKAQELVADPNRHGGDNEAQKFFEDGFGKAFRLIREIQNPEYPFCVFYAFKQSETDVDGDNNTLSISSTGWESMLEGLLKAGIMITGTWPLDTEMANRTRGMRSNALKASVVFACRQKPSDAPIATRRELIGALKQELPDALCRLQRSNIAPVDMAQSSIGPGMAIFSRYSKVLEADGSPMRVRTALQLINRHLDEYLSEQEGEYDPDTRWALSWFEQYGMNEGPFGDAETLSKAKNTSVQGMVEAGILKAGAGKVRLLLRDEMDPNWDPATDLRLTVWEATHHLILALEAQGEAGAAKLQQKLGSYAQSARDLAYRLYSICERQGWSQEALAYNSLVTVWPRLAELRQEREAQRDLGSFTS